MRQSKVQCSDVEWGGEKYNGRGYAVTVTLECLCWDLLPSRLIIIMMVMMSVWRRKGVSKNVSLSATRCHLLSARNSILYQLQPTAQWTLHSGQVDTGATTGGWRRSKCWLLSLPSLHRLGRSSLSSPKYFIQYIWQYDTRYYHSEPDCIKHNQWEQLKIPSSQTSIVSVISSLAGIQRPSFFCDNSAHREQVHEKTFNNVHTV